MHDPNEPALIAEKLGGRRRGTNLWMARCPAHDDSTPSLAIINGRNRTVFRCHAGCEQQAVVDALISLGLLGKKNGRPREDRPRTFRPSFEPKRRWTALPEAPPTLRLPRKRDGSGWAIVHRDLGTPSMVWPYHTAGGVAGFACRFELGQGEKEVLPLAPAQNDQGKNLWLWMGFAQPRPLYRLRDILARPDAPILVHEGEKSADAGQLLFPQYVSTTSPGGSNAVGLADWRPAKGRHVIILRDHDPPGQKYAAQVAWHARAAGADRVSLLHWPLQWIVTLDEQGSPRLQRRQGQPKAGWDAADAEADGWTGPALGLLPDLVSLVPVVEFAKN